VSAAKPGSLGQLLAALQPLLADPERAGEEILGLLRGASGLAEAEIASYLVFTRVGPAVERRLQSEDPLERLAGLDLLAFSYPQHHAAQALRLLIKDANRQVRSRARKVMRRLLLEDVALPDTTNPVSRWVTKIGPRTVGAWNPTGWGYGMYARRPQRRDAIRRLDLPVLLERGDVLRWLGIDGEEGLRRLLRPGAGPGAPYVEFEIPKRSGGTRRICAPRRELKQVQRRILDDLLAKLPVHPACQGFVAGRSVVSNATPHQGAALILKLDLASFFPTVHYRRVEGFFESLGYPGEVASMLAGLTTHRPTFAGGRVGWPGTMPQGAPTSPALANLLCQRLDTRLAGLAEKLGARYTRYADDLTFSFAAAPERSLGRITWWIDQICSQEGFRENAGKRRILRPSNRQQVTGVVVNDGLHVPRDVRRRLRAILHNCRRDGLEAQARGRPHFAATLRGWAAYVRMVEPEAGAKLHAAIEEVVRRG
jgi:hypothetical protein